MFDHQGLSSLFNDVDGIWFPKSQSPGDISYPADGHNDCFAVEESSYWFRHRAESLQSMIQRYPSQGPILDVGGGNGYMSHFLQSKRKMILLEPGVAGALNAKSRGVDQVICGELNDLESRFGEVSAMALFDVLEHIDPNTEFLKTVYAALAPGGRLYLSVPAYSFLWSEEDVSAGHFLRYTKTSLQNQLSRYGFKSLYLGYLFSWLPLPIFLLRSLPYRLGRTRDESVLVEQAQKQHTGGSDLISKMVYASFGFERRLIQWGGSVPFGSSLIAVAEKPSSPE